MLKLCSEIHPINLFLKFYHWCKVIKQKQKQEDVISLHRDKTLLSIGTLKSASAAEFAGVFEGRERVEVLLFVSSWSGYLCDCRTGAVSSSPRVRGQRRDYPPDQVWKINKINVPNKWESYRSPEGQVKSCIFPGD